LTIKYLDAKRIRGSSTAGASDGLGSSADMTNSGGTQNITGILDKGWYTGTSGGYTYAGSTNADWAFMNTTDCKFSIAFWCKLASSGNAIADGDLILGTGNGESEISMALRCNGTGGSFGLHIYGTAEVVAAYSPSGYLQEDGNWHHYVVTWDQTLGSSNLKIYKDGGTAITGNKANDSTSTSSPAHVFSLGGGLGNDFKGNFDEVSVWNRVLTSGEVASLRNSGTGIVTTTLADLSDLKAYWNLNATSGTYTNSASATDEKATLITTIAASSADFTDIYDATSASGWTTNAGSGITINNHISGKLSANAIPDNSANRVTKALGLTLSDTSWVAQFEFMRTSGANAHYPFMVAAGTGQIWNATQDHIGIEMNSTGMQIKQRNGSSSTGGTTIAISADTQYYCTIIRNTADLITFEVRTVSHTGSHVSGSPQTLATSSSTSGLTTLHHSGRADGGAGSSSSWQVDNVNIYDGVVALISASSSTNLPENTLFEETDTYKTYWLQSAEWKNSYVNANLLSVGGSTDANSVISYSDAAGWSSALTDYPFDAGMAVVAGNSDNAQVAQGNYTNQQSYKYYGATNTYSANVGNGIYAGSNGAGGGEQDNMIVYGGNTGGGGAHAKDLCSKYLGASSWVTLDTLSKVYREAGGGRGTPDSAIIVCGEDASFAKYDSVENYSGASDAWSTNSTAFPFDFNNGIYFGTATEGVGGMGTRSAGVDNRTYYTSNGGDTWSATSQNCTYSAYGIGCAGNSNEYGLCWAGNTGSAVNNCVDYSQASGWAASGNTFPRTDYQCRGSGNASG